jgi:chromosome segregation ATPase
MNEQEQAKRVAEMWLDFDMNPLTQMIPGENDCDACVLARQYLRMCEEIEHWRAESLRRAEKCDELTRNCSLLRLSAEFLQGDNAEKDKTISSLYAAIKTNKTISDIIEKDRNDLLAECKELHAELTRLRRLEERFMDGDLKGV